MIKLPDKPKIVLRENNRAVFEIDGLYPGYGVTLGNSIRRVLLSSIQGAAVFFVKIKGVQHEFSIIPGVLEDVVDIMLNIKQLRFKIHSDESQKLFLKVKGKKEVSAKDITAPTQVEIVNKDLHIASLTTKNAELDIELTCEKGFGYVPVEARKKEEKLEAGTMAVDSIYAPIKKVSYEVENMRVGDRTDFNRLRIHIETDGTITPEEALSEALSVLRDQFQNIQEGIAELTPKKKAPTKKTITKKAPAKKPPVKKVAIKKSAVKKASTKKVIKKK